MFLCKISHDKIFTECPGIKVVSCDKIYACYHNTMKTMQPIYSIYLVLHSASLLLMVVLVFLSPALPLVLGYEF